uniref:heat shock cognate 70 kDa protein-like n=1 Tax=Styela clava TaxID=7725 RepID=UPI0019394074|nr:heat shock cognate 70 kDa protein-like [Styela clava]
MVKRAEKFKIEDEAWLERNKQVNNLEEFAYSVKHAVNGENFENVADGDKMEVINKCNEVIAWVKLNRNPGIQQTKENLEKLVKTCRPVFLMIPGGSALLRKLEK